MVESDETFEGDEGVGGGVEAVHDGGDGGAGGGASVVAEGEQGGDAVVGRRRRGGVGGGAEDCNGDGFD